MRVTPHTYTIERGEHIVQVVGRDRAVERARTLSSRSGRPIRLRRDDRKMNMEFRRGTLITYKLETR